MTRSAGNRFRTRKLSTKQTLAILRENQIDSVDDDGQRNIPQIETGVERQEEIEHHLQAAISAHQAAAVGSKDSKKVFIPTPNTTELSAEHYEKIYPKRFHQPFSYIRSSATVEDCCGTSYCMSAEDDKYLAKLNSTRKSTLSSITEDEFETIMDLYESTIQQTQPYLSMDVMNIIPFEELEHAFEENLDANLRAVAKSVYSYWKEQKISRGGRSIIPCLKFEQGNEKDEGDPYVCFRRREVRQVRKTRRTDAQSTEKLKKIRQEFETARGLVKDVLQREQMRRTSFVFEKQIFEQRRTAVELKRKLNIKDTDEDLVNKVCPKRTRTEPAAPPALRIPLRQDGKPPDADLRQLSTARAEDEKRRLEKYNQLRKLRPLSKYPMVDLTQDALFRQANPTTAPPVSNFCSVQTFYLPSPPHTAESTASSPGSGSISLRQGQVSIIQASPKKMPSRNLPTFRRRLGRGGRILIDRRGHASVSTDGVDPMVIDRIKFDNNDDEPDLVFPVDPYSDRQVKFRAQMLSPPPEHSLAQTPTIRRQVMASSPVVMTPGNSPANLLQRGMTNGHHPVPPHNPTMAHNAMQVNGHSTASFPTRR